MAARCALAETAAATAATTAEKGHILFRDVRFQDRYRELRLRQSNRTGSNPIIGDGRGSVKDIVIVDRVHVRPVDRGNWGNTDQHMFYLPLPIAGVNDNRERIRGFLLYHLVKPCDGQFVAHELRKCGYQLVDLRGIVELCLRGIPDGGRMRNSLSALKLA